MRVLCACLAALTVASASGQVTIEELYRRSTVLAGDRRVSFDPIAGLTPGVDNGKPIDYLLTRDLTNVPFSSLIEWQDDGSAVVIDEFLRLFSSDPAGYLPVLAEDGVQVFSLITGTPPVAALDSIAIRIGGVTSTLIEPGDAKPNGGTYTSPAQTYLRDGVYLSDGTSLTEIVPDFLYVTAAVDRNDNVLIQTSIDFDTLIAVIDSSGNVTEVYSEADPLVGGRTGLVGLGTDAIDGETVVFSALIQFHNNDLESVVFLRDGAGTCALCCRCQRRRLAQPGRLQRVGHQLQRGVRLISCFPR